MDRVVSEYFVPMYKLEGWRKEADIKHLLDIDARERGVRITKLTLTDDGVHAIVAWL